MRRLIISLLLFSVVAMAADFERSNWRMQLYLQAEPTILVFEDSDPQFLVKKDIEKELFSVPLSFGFLCSSFKP